MRERKKWQTKMVTTTTMIEYMFVVLLISGLNSQSARSQKISAKLNNNNNDNNDPDSRKLKDNVEIITYSNLIVDDSSSSSKKAKPKYDVHDNLDMEEDTKEYQYFNDASAVSTPKYEHDLSPNYDLTKYESPKYESLQYDPPTNYDPSNYEASNYEPPKYGPPLPPLLSSIKIPSNFKIDESDLTHSYYTQQQFEQMPYVPSDPLIGDGPIPVPVSVPASTHEMLPIDPATSISHIQPISHQPIHSGPSHIVKVTHRPIWAPEMQKLESQYMDAYRSIKSSVLSFYYKMHYLVNYFMSLFTFAGELNALIIIISRPLLRRKKKQQQKNKLISYAENKQTKCFLIPIPVHSFSFFFSHFQSFIPFSHIILALSVSHSASFSNFT